MNGCVFRLVNLCRVLEVYSCETVDLRIGPE